MSQILQLTKNDFFKGAVVAVITAPLTMIVTALSNGNPLDLKSIGIVALIAFCSYILKNLGTDENGKFLGGSF